MDTAQARTHSAGPVTATVTGTLADGTGTLLGTFDLSNFVATTELRAVGTFTGTVRYPSGNVITGTQNLSLPVDPVASTGASRLVVTPAELSMLGLEARLAGLELEIDPAPGPNDRFEDALAAVTELLQTSSSSGATAELATLLNELLSVRARSL